MAPKIRLLKNFPEIIGQLLNSNLTKLWPIHGINISTNDWNGVDYLVEQSPRHQGVVAEVFKGWNFRNDLFVAIKGLREFRKGEKKYQQSLRSEFEALKDIDHSGVPKIYGFTDESPNGQDPSPKIIIEYVEGGSLGDRLKSNIPLEVDEVISVVNDVGSTIDYLAKKHELFHGDININQIIMSKKFKKLIDFGMSNKVSEDGEFYTQGFAAPERYYHEGKKVIRNLATEEFSLAVVAYYMITSNVTKLNIKNLENPTVEFANISKTNLKYNLDDSDIEKLNKIFKKALATKPEERYKSASDFAREFTAIMKNAKGLNQSFGHKVLSVVRKVFDP